ncbi:MAG: FAD-dependent oxidoreductase [Acidimicrobiales bacterium]
MASTYPPRTIVEPARSVDVVHETDVLVVGSGPAGLSAALAAARVGGIDVVLVERFGCFGGNITTVGVEGMAWYRHAATVEANGIGREFEERAYRMGAAIPESQSDSYEIDAEGFKVVADRMIEEAGIRPMLHRMFVSPVMDGDRVVGIITESKAGRDAILAKRVIDATGDADVAHRAGATTVRTPREHMMATSVMFHLAGVDKRRFAEGVAADPQTYADWAGNGQWDIETDGKEDAMFSPFLHKPFARAVADGLIPDNLTTLAGTWGAIHDSGELTYMNVVHLGELDGTDPEDLTRGEMEGRRHALHAIEALRSFTPGCENARLRNFGMTLGVRDTRKILARYNMTESDVRHQGRFEDSIGIFPEFIDGYGILILPTTGRYFQLPYRNLIPTGVRNLLVAGRSSGGDRISHAATRNMGCCAVLGQGAGIGAALSLKSGVEVDEVPIIAVQTELENQEVRYR